MIQRRVLIADGAPLFRSGVRHLLTREGDFVLTEASDFDELLQAMEHEAQEIALIDLDLPPYGGVAAVGHLAAQSAARFRRARRGRRSDWQPQGLRSPCRSNRR